MISPTYYFVFRYKNYSPTGLCVRQILLSQKRTVLFLLLIILLSYTLHCTKGLHLLPVYFMWQLIFLKTLLSCAFTSFRYSGSWGRTFVFAYLDISIVAFGSGIVLMTWSPFKSLLIHIWISIDEHPGFNLIDFTGILTYEILMKSWSSD